MSLMSNDFEGLIKELDRGIRNFNEACHSGNLFKRKNFAGYVAGILDALSGFGYSYNYRESPDGKVEDSFFIHSDEILFSLTVIDKEGQEVYNFDLESDDFDLYMEVAPAEDGDWEGSWNE